MLKCTSNLILTRMEPWKIIILSRRPIQNIMDLLMFSRKIVTIETIEDSIQFIGFFGSVHCGDFFCALPFTYPLINFTPFHTLFMLLYVI